MINKKLNLQSISMTWVWETEWLSWWRALHWRVRLLSPDPGGGSVTVETVLSPPWTLWTNDFTFCVTSVTPDHLIKDQVTFWQEWTFQISLSTCPRFAPWPQKDTKLVTLNISSDPCTITKVVLLVTFCPFNQKLCSANSESGG